jgi:predicted transcriptional regulator
VGRKRGIPESERVLRLELARALSSVIGTERGAQSHAAQVLGISRAALSLYLLQKATPGSEILRRILTTWNLTLDILGIKVDASSFTVAKPSTDAVVSEQPSLFNAISVIENRQLEVKVIRKDAHSIDLKVSIDFRKTG